MTAHEPHKYHYEIYRAAKVMLPGAQQDLAQAMAALKALECARWRSGIKGWWAMRGAIRTAKTAARVCRKKLARMEMIIWEWE